MATATDTGPLTARRDVTPAPARGRPVQLAYSGALDGLRGLAVLAVVLYHGGVTWAKGGFLGVEVFFVLSGYLITSLLLAEWLQSGQIALRAFWARRARRLLPALFALVIVVAIYYAAAWPVRTVPGLPSNTVATLLYAGNWHQITAGTSYFAASGPISPFQQTWSLAIEEQFYAIWPLLVLGVLCVAGGVVARRRGPAGGVASTTARLRVLLAVALLGAVASAVQTALLFDGGRGLNRVYLGTDTRAGGLLIGAALAITLILRRPSDEPTSPPARRGRRAGAPDRRTVVSIASAGVLLGMLAEMYVSSDSSAGLFPYGLDLLDAAVATVIAAVVLMPDSLPGRVLCAAPLRATGRVSYGLYLWHFPLFLWLDTAATGLSGVRLLVVRIVASVTVSLLSYVLIERPIRQRGRWRPLWPAYAVAAFGGVAAVAALIGGSLSSTLSAGVVVADAVGSSLASDQPTCTVALHDTPSYGVVPVAASRLASFEGAALGSHTLVWHGSGRTTFPTCHPKRILMIGDSIAFTLGMPMLDDEQRYGLEIADGALLGCAFSNRGQLGVGGTWSPPSDSCTDPLSTWAADERRLHASEVIIELGYRDEFDWRWDGRIVHLGQPAFDAYVQSQIDRFVRVLGQHGTKILFLSVPSTDPPAQPNGSPALQASPARLELINTMLATAAGHDHGEAAFLNIDQTISPGHRFDATVDGEPCRIDGIHPDPLCAALVEPRILSRARALSVAP